MRWRVITLCLALFLLAGSIIPLSSAKVNQKGGKISLGARTIGPPTPVWVIGSYNRQGKPNVMTAAWVGICCSKPPMVTVSLAEERYSYGNIMARRAFTVNIPSARFAKETAYFGTVSGRNVDKFTATGLTPVRGEYVDAPYIKEFPLVIECKLIKTVKLGSHTMFIGRIMDVKVDKTILGERDRPDIKKMNPFVFNQGNFAFYAIGDFLGKIRPLARKISSSSPKR